MVVKRSCSFCAGEVEPGTGMMFVKKDGTAFFFCSSVCRRDQLKLGRVGHRFKWTRAYQSKKALEMSQAAASAAQAKTQAVKPAPKTKVAPEPKPLPTPEKTVEPALATPAKAPPVPAVKTPKTVTDLSKAPAKATKEKPKAA